MDPFLDYKNFKTDVLECLNISITKFALKYNQILSSEDDDDYVVVLENDFCLVKITMLDYFPRIIVDYYFYDKASVEKPISDKQLKEILQYTSDEVSRFYETGNFNTLEASIQMQLRTINLLFINLFNPILNGYFW